MAIITITDSDSGETTQFEECESCQGLGEYDVSIDCEAYEDWHRCEECDGEGIIEIGSCKDKFVPERDAWTPND